ncbi:hypothetical protein PSEUDO9AZ_40840 [Pseudomonas sp. 9AZ]|nr:hypothetical protein PSEUDO9AZ_40840 [Pseudomonas sp. 9AZ]
MVSHELDLDQINHVFGVMRSGDVVRYVVVYPASR